MREKLIEKFKKIKNNQVKKDLLKIFLRKELFFKKFFKNVDIIGTKQSNTEKIKKIINKLQSKEDIFVDKKSNDIYYKTRSIGCTYCTMGKGVTVVLSYKCNRDCFFCYEETPLDPKVKIDPYNKEDMDNIYKKIDTSFIDKSNKTLAITGGEPLLFIDKVYEVLEYVNKKYPGKHTRIYTSGDFLDEDKLKKLNQLELDELRFSIKPGEDPNIELYKLSKKYIKTVLIEMPIMPDSKKYMIHILTKIDKANCVDGINLNELTFNNINADKYKENNLKLDLLEDNNSIYHRYYDIPKVEIGVYGSKLLALELIDYFSEKNASFFMHYCDLNTVSFHHYVYKINYAKSLNIGFSQINNFGLHKVLRIYGEKSKILKIFKNNNLNYIENNNYFETSVLNKELFNGEDIFMIIIYKNYDYKYELDFEFCNNLAVELRI